MPEVSKPKINSQILFELYLKSLNNFYNLSHQTINTIKDSVDIVNRLNYPSYYKNLTNTFSEYLVPNFEYLFVTGLYFSISSIIGNSFFYESYLQKIFELMSKNNDPLKDSIFSKDGKLNKYLSNYSSLIPTKVFEFLGDNFIGKAGWVAKSEELPEQAKLIELYLRAQNLLNIINQAAYIDQFLKRELENFCDLFASSFPKYKEISDLLYKIKKDHILSQNIEIWKKVISSIASNLATINEVIKPYGINSEKDVSNTVLLLVNLNISQKDPSQFNLVLKNLNDNNIKKVIDDNLMVNYNFGINKNEALKDLSKSLYSTFVGILSSFLKKSIKNSDLKYGDSFYFIQIYSLSSILLDFINEGKTNTIEYNNIKIRLKNLLITKKFASNLVNYLDHFNKDVVISVLEVLKRIGQKVSPWVIQKSPDMPKDKSFWVRLNLWTKVYSSLDKNDPNYKKNKQFMINKLRNIFLSYLDTTKFSLFVNNLTNNDYVLDNFIKNFSSILNTIAGFPSAQSYPDPDYVYSQLTRLMFLKDENTQSNNNINNKVMKNRIHLELITKIMSKDKVLNKIILDYNEYKYNLKLENINKSLYDVLNTFYGASAYYL